MKNIAFINWDISQLGGINQVTHTLANSLSNNFNIYIISLVCKKEKSAYEFNERIVYQGGIIKGECRARQLIFRGYKKLRKYILQNEIEVVFLMGFQVSGPAILMTRGIKCKFIMCEHEALMSRWNEKKIRLIRYLTAKTVDKVIVLTKQTANDYIEKFRLKPDKVDYIYNGIGSNVLNCVKNYKTNSKVILSAGRFAKEKGYDNLVKVAGIVFERHKDWLWYVYGDGEEFEKIQEMVKANHLENNLILKGEVTNLEELYAEGAMFVLTSYREGLPLVLLEAKANYLPCISFDIVSGPQEIIQDGKDGFLIEPFNIKNMAEKICYLIENKEVRVQFSEWTQNNIKKFDNNTIITQWIELTNSICSE